MKKLTPKIIFDLFGIIESIPFVITVAELRTSLNQQNKVGIGFAEVYVKYKSMDMNNNRITLDYILATPGNFSEDDLINGICNFIGMNIIAKVSLPRARVLLKDIEVGFGDEKEFKNINNFL